MQFQESSGSPRPAIATIPPSLHLYDHRFHLFEPRLPTSNGWNGIHSATPVPPWWASVGLPRVYVSALSETSTSKPRHLFQVSGSVPRGRDVAPKATTPPLCLLTWNRRAVVATATCRGDTKRWTVPAPRSELLAPSGPHHVVWRYARERETHEATVRVATSDAPPMKDAKRRHA
eukprot:scaffold2848_cov352-Pavlova_lutheri.AAC.28